MAKLKTTQQLAIKYYRTKFKILTSISKRKAAEKAFELFCTPQIRNKKKLPKIFETAERLQLNVDGIIVRGWRFNHPAERKVLILHGYESSVTNFDRYVKPLISKGYEVVAFDAPANGRSDGKQITLPLYSKMIKEIHTKFGPVQSYLAHSFGGLAVSLALEEINHDANYRLALIAPASETSTAINTFFSFLKLSPDIREEFEKIIIQKGGVHSDWYSIARAMKNIKANVLWFHDEDDDVTPLSDAMTVKEANYPNVEFVITKGLGHRRIYRDNEVVKAIVEFL
ncbi:MAG: alpha/beta fold hydrolase [Chitinophagaceae bacterium]|nr:alpha/beta fold hydrolase [Chitinophagaceae bacterium]MBK8312162.1 alpha/beta fold hydrolase [Chitinophagaceae bacterium]MBK8605552.1 alpha/beta fold hydrolase [Chitinophagaceae bacterium]MBP6477042.1 alpha/beta fold hydrolase [Chitinophagaceae bacterium]MBP7108732.1 alpha/beta fold hydrolase [Chitinophagaceae bacterium]